MKIAQKFKGEIVPFLRGQIEAHYEQAGYNLELFDVALLTMMFKRIAE